MRQLPARISRSLILLTLIAVIQIRTAGPWLISTRTTLPVSTHYSPPFNETIPPPVSLTISFGYGLAQSGPQSVIVLCVEFTNQNHTKTKSEIEDVAFSKVSQYFREASYGRISLSGHVSRWYQMNKTVGAYGRDGLNVDDPNGDGSPDSWMLIQEAIDAADSEVDFSQYSYLAVLHAGSGQETSGNLNDLWSCAYLMGVWFRTRDGVSFSKAMIVPETESQGAVNVGVFAHEFAHLLGLPDLYDPYRRSDYVGRWELMAKGLWNGNPPSSSPAHMLAWSKIRLGWISESQVAVVPSGVIRNVTLSPIELNGTTLAVKIPLTDKTYYLVELRQRIGYDLGLPDTGLIVTYIDGNIGGPGCVQIVDANPLTATLDDCTFKSGRTFSDTSNKVFVSISEATGQSYRLLVNRVGPAPDLSVTKPEITPYPARSGRTLTLMFRIMNQGTTIASSFTIHVYMDLNLIYNNTHTLEAGQSHFVHLTWNATYGKHVMKCVVDSANQLSDINRLNNEVTYEFVVGLILSVRLPWAGGSVRVNGTTYAANGTMMIEVPILQGQQAVEVPRERSLSAGKRQIFVRWGDGDTSNPRVYLATGDATLSAEYKTQYHLAVDSGKGATLGNGWYDENSTAMVTATSPFLMNSGKTRLVFSHWSGTQVSNSSSLQISMNRPYNLTANWIVEHYLAVISQVGSFAERKWHREGIVVLLRVSSPVDQGNRTRKVFVSWSGNITSESVEITVSMTGPRTIIANWRTEYELRVLSERGKPLGQCWISAGATAKFSVEPMVSTESGIRYVFAKWTGDYNGALCEGSVVMDGPKTVSATWRTQYLVSLKVIGLPNGTNVSVRINSKWHNHTMPFVLSEWSDADSSVNLEAPTKIQTDVDEYVFQGWRNPEGQPIDLPQAINSPRVLELVYLRKPKGLLNILAVTYGPDRPPELSLLEEIRERHIPRTFAGRHWSGAFEQLCRSLAPKLAESIGENPTLKAVLRVLLYPTLQILVLTGSVFTAIGPSSETAFFAAGFTASALAGVVYLTPLSLLGLHVSRRRRLGTGQNLPKYVGIALVIGVEVIVFGEITRAPMITAAATFLFFAATALLSSVAMTLSMCRIAKQIRTRRMTKRAHNSKTLMGLSPNASIVRVVSQ